MEKSVKQFILSMRPVDAPDLWLTQQLFGFYLYHCPSLPVTRTTLRGKVGVLLGWTTHALSGLELEKYDDICGRWVFVSDTGVVSLDPLGSFSVVYSPELGITASSTSVIPDERLIPDHSLNEALDLPVADAWYPFGLTPYKNVRRLLPGHELDLLSFSSKRSLEPAETSASESPIDIIASNLRGQLSLLKRNPIMMGITAGNESRMLLSALKRPNDNCRFFTFCGPKDSQDALTAKCLAKKFKLDHVTVRTVRDQFEEALWFSRVGRCVSGATLRNAKSKSLLPADSVLIKGIGGEIGRGYYFRDSDLSGKIPEAKELLDRIGLPHFGKILDEANDWLTNTPTTDVYSLLELLYIENRVGCWAAPQLHGDVYNKACIWPLNQASTIAAMRELPRDVKTNDEMCALVVKLLWPDLLSVPLNKHFGIRKLIFMLKSRIRNQFH